MNNLVLGIAIPSMDIWHARFGLCLASMCAHLGMKRIGDYSSQTIHLLTSRGSMIPQQRENLIITAKKCGCTHLLFLDSDMTFPKDLVHRMIVHDLPIVAANCVIKKIPASPTAVLPSGEKLYTDPDSTGLVKVLQVGFAVALFKMEVFPRVERPWFDMKWNSAIQHFMGEDIHFCRKLREKHIDIHIDQDVSKEVGHIGSFIFDHTLVGEIVYEDPAEVRSANV